MGLAGWAAVAAGGKRNEVAGYEWLDGAAYSAATAGRKPPQGLDFGVASESWEVG